MAPMDNPVSEKLLVNSELLVNPEHPEKLVHRVNLVAPVVLTKVNLLVNVDKRVRKDRKHKPAHPADMDLMGNRNDQDSLELPVNGKHPVNQEQPVLRFSFERRSEPGPERSDTSVTPRFGPVRSRSRRYVAARARHYGAIAVPTRWRRGGVRNQTSIKNIVLLII